MNDLHNNCDAVVVIPPIALTTVAGLAGAIIDRQGYGGVEFLFSYGAITATNATITTRLKEGDVTGTLTSVADADLLGTEALAAIPAAVRTDGTGDKVTKRLGYKGNKRYLQASIAAATVTSATIVSVVALLHNPMIAPVANP